MIEPRKSQVINATNVSEESLDKDTSSKISNFLRTQKFNNELDPNQSLPSRVKPITSARAEG